MELAIIVVVLCFLTQCHSLHYFSENNRNSKIFTYNSAPSSAGTNGFELDTADDPPREMIYHHEPNRLAIYRSPDIMWAPKNEDIAHVPNCYNREKASLCINASGGTGQYRANGTTVDVSFGKKINYPLLPYLYGSSDDYIIVHSKGKMYQNHLQKLQTMQGPDFVCGVDGKYGTSDAYVAGFSGNIFYVYKWTIPSNLWLEIYRGEKLNTLGEDDCSFVVDQDENTKIILPTLPSPKILIQFKNYKFDKKTSLDLDVIARRNRSGRRFLPFHGCSVLSGAIVCVEKGSGLRAWISTDADGVPDGDADGINTPHLTRKGMGKKIEKFRQMGGNQTHTGDIGRKTFYVRGDSIYTREKEFDIPGECNSIVNAFVSARKENQNTFLVFCNFNILYYRPSMQAKWEKKLELQATVAFRIGSTNNIGILIPSGDHHEYHVITFPENTLVLHFIDDVKNVANSGITGFSEIEPDKFNVSQNSYYMIHKDLEPLKHLVTSLQRPIPTEMYTIPESVEFESPPVESRPWQRASFTPKNLQTFTVANNSSANGLWIGMTTSVTVTALLILSALLYSMFAAGPKFGAMTKPPVLHHIETRTFPLSPPG